MALPATAVPLTRPVKVGELVKRRLRELGRSPRDLAEALGLPERWAADLVAGRRRPPAPAQSQVYESMTRFLRLHRNDLPLCARAEHEERDNGRGRPARRVRELLLALCVPGRARTLARRLARPGGVELERLIVDRLLAVTKGFARRQLEDEFGIRIAARRAGSTPAERRLQLLEFLDTTVATLTPEDVTSFMQPRLDGWDIDLETRAMRIVLKPSDPGVSPRLA